MKSANKVIELKRGRCLIKKNRSYESEIIEINVLEITETCVNI